MRKSRGACISLPAKGWLLCITLLGIAGGGYGQEASDPNRAESLQNWQYYAEVPLTPQGEASLYEFFLTPQVYDAARFDLGDLRLYDAKEQEIPYALRVLEEKSSLETLSTQTFNRLQLPDGTRQLSLDLGTQEIEHNQVKVQTTGVNFRRRVVIEGADDKKNWQELVSDYLLYFRHEGETFQEITIDYPPSRFRYLRVRVHPDLAEDAMAADPQAEGSWALENVFVRRHVDIPGEMVTRSLEYNNRQPTRTSQGPGSQWLIELGGSSVPCAELVVEIENDDFVRDWEVESAGPDNRFSRVYAGTWQRKAGEEKTTFVARFPQEIRAARLKLLVTDYRNPPLTITSIKSRAPARQIVFQADRPEFEQPLRLYFANPDAIQPRYDFARNLPERLKRQPTRLELGERAENPIYQPEPKPFTERFPWLVHSVFAAAILVMAFLIVNLAQAALNRPSQEGTAA